MYMYYHIFESLHNGDHDGALRTFLSFHGTPIPLPRRFSCLLLAVRVAMGFASLVPRLSHTASEEKLGRVWKLSRVWKAGQGLEKLGEVWKAGQGLEKLGGVWKAGQGLENWVGS